MKRFNSVSKVSIYLFVCEFVNLIKFYIHHHSSSQLRTAHPGQRGVRAACKQRRAVEVPILRPNAIEGLAGEGAGGAQAARGAAG